MLLKPYLKVWTSLYFESENLWFQVNCVKNGGETAVV